MITCVAKVDGKQCGKRIYGKYKNDKYPLCSAHRKELKKNGLIAYLTKEKAEEFGGKAGWIKIGQHD